ncbi:MAG: polysaccharide deacetylase family protein [Anaerolineales bacterium]
MPEEHLSRRDFLKLLLTALGGLIASCLPRLPGEPDPTAAPSPSSTVIATSTFTQTATSTPVQSVPAPPTPGESPIPTPSPIPTSTWQWQGPDQVICPILLYHRIATPPFPNPYYVTPENFRAQMQALREWGYTSIPISLLVRAIKQGAPMPPRPVVISFDDGDISVYDTAFPIMQEIGFIGVNYIVSNRLRSEGYMNVQQLLEMVQYGWEVGSHSVNHANLVEDANPRFQLEQSRRDLETALKIPVETFAWPFGNFTPSLLKLASRFYEAAVGLGPQHIQTYASLFYLRRRGVPYDWDVQTFGSFLPWNTPPQPS